MGKARQRRPARLGAPHRRYRAPWIARRLTHLFALLTVPLRYGELTSLARANNIPTETLRRWHDNILADPDWRPGDAKWGEHRRIFSEITERTMAEYIRSEFISKHRIFTTEDFQAIARDWYRRTYWNSDKAPRFTCSRSFIRGFMRRNRFSLRRQHFKRRPPATVAAIDDWIQNLSVLLDTHDNDLILNCDETAWRLYPNNILTWWNTGDDDVSIHVNGDEKGCFTVLATISASRKKWPLFFVAKGKTQRVEHSQIGGVSEHWRTHSESGWMKGELFCEYLKHIRAEIPTGDRIFLICDVHSSHRTQPVKALAAALNIELLYIPPGATDQLQPLDRTVFGVLKSEARRLFRIRTSHDPEIKRSKRDAVAEMITAWQMLSESSLESAWAIYQVEDEWNEIDA